VLLFGGAWLERRKYFIGYNLLNLNSY